MNKKRKSKKFNSVTAAASVRRSLEIETFGKLVTIKASVVHKSKKDYNRRHNKIKLDSLDW